MVPGEKMLSRILDCVPQPIWAVGPDGCILYTNPSAVAVLGYDEPRTLAGRPTRRCRWRLIVRCVPAPK
ncbi:PAS domain-containing protein [Saccharopolyspora shandongensis]|uniref:PAS domain-containing protein n=1 Tax=Saccharopolyspora shandongensis TaxID=418495 RepID=UPI000B811694